MSDPFPHASNLALGTGAVERRADLVIEGKPLMCGIANGPGPADPLAFPDAYIAAAVADAQAALRAMRGVRAALVSVTIRVTPYCAILADDGGD